MSPELEGTLEYVRSGRRLHVAGHDRGAATTLFFLHGGGGNKEQWRFQWRALRDSEVNLVAWDAVGHGRSPRSNDPFAYAGTELVADARALIDGRCTANTVLVAHSYGARVALALLQEGVPVDGMVLVGPAPPGQLSGRRLVGGLLGRLPLPLLELARPLLARGFRRRAWHPDADPALVDAEQRATRGNRLSMMQALLSNPPAVDPERLVALHVPTVVLAGEQDGIVPPETVASVAAMLPGAELRMVARCGHQIMLERPDDTGRAIGDVVAAVERRATP